MARTRIVVDLTTGEQSEVAYTPEEEIEADAAYALEQEAQLATAQEKSPTEKLADFLNANPDVRALLD